jgi:hypothetical protein
MARWQPPIPAGALSSPTALRLERALALLARCYDDVDRYGWVKLSLVDLAGEMEIGYSTMKKWWRMLRESGVFSEVEDCGRNGVRAHFRNEWLDWRIMRNNTEGYDHSPEDRTDSSQGYDRSLDDTPVVPNEGHDHSPKNLHVGTHDLQIDSDGDDGDDRRSAPESSPVDLVSFLLDEGMGAAPEFADIPLEVGRADYLARREARQSINHIVRTWRRKRPTAEEHYEHRPDSGNYGIDGPGLRNGPADRGAAESSEHWEREYGADRAGGSGAVERRDAHRGTGPPTGATAAVQAPGRAEGATEPAADDYEAVLAAARERVARAQARRC